MDTPSLCVCTCGNRYQACIAPDINTQPTGGPAPSCAAITRLIPAWMTSLGLDLCFISPPSHPPGFDSEARMLIYVFKFTLKCWNCMFLQTTDALNLCVSHVSHQQSYYSFAVYCQHLLCQSCCWPIWAECCWLKHLPLCTPAKKQSIQTVK